MEAEHGPAALRVGRVELQVLHHQIFGQHKELLVWRALELAEHQCLVCVGAEIGDHVGEGGEIGHSDRLRPEHPGVLRHALRYAAVRQSLNQLVDRLAADLLQHGDDSLHHGRPAAGVGHLGRIGIEPGSLIERFGG